jgi:hypothetical protein
MPTSGYFLQNLRRPLPIKDDGIRTVADAGYMMALSKDRQRAHWQRAARLILDEAHADDLSRQVKRPGSRYGSGRSPAELKFKNPAAPAHNRTSPTEPQRRFIDLVVWIGRAPWWCPPSCAAYRIPGRHHTIVQIGMGLRRSQCGAR